MAIFENEPAMQKWLKGMFDQGEQLGDLVLVSDEVHNGKFSSEDQRAIQASFQYILEFAYCTEVMAADANISATKSEVLRPDFVLYAPEAQGIMVVELKNFSAATRETGTEIGAYAGEIRSQLPFIADADVMSVIISPEWPTLLRHYVVQEIYWRRRKVLCLQPVEVDGEVRLETVDIEFLAAGNISLKAAAHYLGGYHICLYDDELQAGSEDRERLTPYEEQMRTALRVLATEGEAHGLTGFAFLWKDKWEQSLAPYMITLVNFAPFQQLDQILRRKNGWETATDFQRTMMEINAEFDPQGHTGALMAQTRAIDSILERFCRPMPEGFNSWVDLRRQMWPRVERMVAFETWGAFTPRYLDMLRGAYKVGNGFEYSHGELGWDFVESIVDYSAEPPYWPMLFGDDEDEDMDFDDINDGDGFDMGDD